MNKLKMNKKAVELTLQTIIVMIIVIIVLVVMIVFFSNHFGDNSQVFLNTSSSVIDEAKKNLEF